MQIEQDQQQQTARFTLEASLCIFDVDGLHRQLLENIPESTTWEWDLSAVEECDSAGLQWLLMVRDWSGKNGIECRFEHVSDAINELADLYRVSGAMGLTTVLPAKEVTSGRR